ncbi:MAG: tRNA-dihydrouridine synthase, partial [Gammaproteobacteria bacterium]
ALSGDDGAEAPDPAHLAGLMQEHLESLHDFYGEQAGLRIARKHVGWYLGGGEAARAFLRGFNAIESGRGQCESLAAWFETGADNEALAA